MIYRWCNMKGRTALMLSYMDECREVDGHVVWLRLPRSWYLIPIDLRDLYTKGRLRRYTNSNHLGISSHDEFHLIADKGLGLTRTRKNPVGILILLNQTTYIYSKKPCVRPKIYSLRILKL